ncbi:MAG: response regulator transcription factor [Chloroflexota bacterium]
MATILVVDDEKPVREFLAAALEQAGHRVLQAPDGRHALDMMASGGQLRPDLVISDVMMPVIGGIELCAFLKGNPATSSIPVVLMSAAARQASTEVRADAYIGKPFDLGTLDALVRRMLSVDAKLGS